MVSVWAEVFELPKTDTTAEDDVVTCLQATREEIDLLRVELKSLGAPDDLSEPGLTRLRNATSTVYLNASWNGISAEVSRPENRVQLAWANWALRGSAEGDMSDEKLSAIRDDLHRLEENLQDSDLSPYLRSFLLRQISTLRAALKLAKVKGVAPLQDACEQVAGAWTLQKVRLEHEAASASESSKGILGSFRAAVKATAELVTDGQAIVEKGGELLEFGKTVFESLTNG